MAIRQTTNNRMSRLNRMNRMNNEQDAQYPHNAHNAQERPHPQQTGLAVVHRTLPHQQLLHTTLALDERPREIQKNTKGNIKENRGQYRRRS